MFRKFIIIIAAFFAVISCKSPEARKPVQAKSGTFINESAARNKKIYEDEKAHIEKLINADADNHYLTSASGFWYYYNQKDTLANESPEFGDIVKFTYDIQDLSGTTIVSEEENGLQYYKVDQSNQELISGIRDAIKLMKEGETVTFIFPSYKAFGYYGIENKLGTNVPIKSTITIHSIKQGDED